MSVPTYSWAGIKWPFDDEPAKPKGTRVWRAYFRDRASFCFGLWVGHDADDAAWFVSKEGDVISVETVT